MPSNELTVTSMTPPPTSALKAALASIPGYLTALEFGPEKAIIAFVAMQILDWATGIAASKKMGDQLSSSRAAQGAGKKGMMWAYIGVVSIGLWLTPMDVDSKRLALATVICGFIWVEMLSIAENGKNLGLIMDPRILTFLSWLEPKKEPLPVPRMDAESIAAWQKLQVVVRKEGSPNE